jgi:multicomponent Na+:H+ antiporter subunit D
MIAVSSLLLPGILLSSLLTGLVIFFVKEERRGLRTTLNLFGTGLKVLLVLELLREIYAGVSHRVSWTILPGIEFALGADANSVLFVSLSAFLWLLTTIYAIGYLEHAPNRSRFFGFFSLCVSAATGVALSANLVTFVIFYELLTISTYPLVVHRGTEKALRAGRNYLAYTLTGGAVLLLATAFLHVLVGPVDFVEGGMLAPYEESKRTALSVCFWLFVAGLGVKTAIVPLHGWLPQAMVAPAPVSALLHAVAVVKAGAFGLIRIVYDVYGISVTAELGLLHPLAIVASTTIIYGSVRALAQDELKTRLAYSTVSQVSYITLGAALFGPTATIGGLVHLVHQGLMKITLFFCAGNYAETLGVHKVSQMNGVGRRMPWTTAAFTIGALGMIGVPPLAGYISKWYLKKGAVLAGEPWVTAVLAVSSVLNAAYFLPILYKAWFQSAPDRWPDEIRSTGGFESTWLLVGPPVITAALVVYAGLFAESPFSPLAWAELIAAREYPQP